MGQIYPDEVGQSYIGANTKSLDEATVLVERRCHLRPACAKCGGERVVRNGHADCLQRYKCRNCGVSFNALTGTSLARLRHRGKRLDQTEVMNDGMSVRKATARLGVDRTTAFRWRHRWLEVARETEARQMTGVVEADETYHLESYKGQVALLRVKTTSRPRRRGGVGFTRGTSAEHTSVLALVSRHGDTTDHVLDGPSAEDVKKVLPGTLAEDAVLCADGSATLGSAARDLAIEHQAVKTSSGRRVRGPWHLQNVNPYHRRFNGISSRYLANYLGWFRALDRNPRNDAKPASLLTLAMGVSAYH